MAIAGESCLKKRERIKVRSERYGALIFSAESPGVCLNEGALRVFELADGKRSASRICDDFEKMGGFRACREEVMKVLQFLVANRILEAVE